MPVTTGLNGTARSPRAVSAARIAPATKVLPTSVSVAVTNRPRLVHGGVFDHRARSRRATRRGRSSRPAGRTRRRHAGAGACRPRTGGRRDRRSAFVRGTALRGSDRHAGRRPPAGGERRLAEHPGGLAQLVLRVRGHDREAQPRRAVGDRGRADRLREDPALERGLADPHRDVGRRRRSAGRSGSSSRRPRSPRARARRAGPRRWRCRRSTRRGCSNEQVERGHRAGDRRRRRGGGEDQRARGVGEVRGHLARRTRRTRRRSRAPCRACRRPRRPRPRARPRRRAAAVGADAAGAVRLVDDDTRVVALGELDDALQRRDVAVHREHAVGDDERRAVRPRRPSPSRTACCRPHSRWSRSAWP